LIASVVIAADEADVVDHAADVRKQLADLDLVLPELRELGAAARSSSAALKLRELLPLRERLRHRLAVHLRELRLRIERLQMRRSARHREPDHPLRLLRQRQIYFWGFHNHDPKQVFKSSVSYTQCFETAPGDLPVFLAYRVNGAPLSLERGGPVRMIVPWSHGYKSIKWLQHIFVTNDARNNDTYAHGNNDPDSVLKTAAYVDKSLDGQKIPAGQPVFITGQVVGGPSGLQRVEYWLRRIEGEPQTLADDAPELLNAPWKPCELEAQPDWPSVLPQGVKPGQVLAFDAATGRPQSWPSRYGMCAYHAMVKNLPPGRYEARARSVDLNGYAQPEPRPMQKTGKNGIQVRRFEIIA
jgi:hypothetical protein